MGLGGCAEDEGIDPPVPLFGEVPIHYPISLWDADIEGSALVRVLVNDTGGVDSVEIVESSGYAAFDTAALKGARDLRFQPARRGEDRIKVWAQVPVHFSKRPSP
jgi:protein TonB